MKGYLYLSAMKFYRLYFIFFWGAISLLGCSGGQKNQDESGKNTLPFRRNTVVLLDLSDRLLKENQAERDLAIIEELAQNFARKAKEELYLANNDRIQIVIAPQQYKPYDEDKYADALEIDMAKIHPKEKRFIGDSIAALMENITNLYREAALGENPEQYAGASIWRYMKEHIQDQFLDQKDFMEINHLVIITDGYLNFESYKGKRKGDNRFASSRFVWKLAMKKDAWRKAFDEGDYGFLPFEKKVLKGIHLHVLEANPYADYHYEILEASWQKWAKEMGAASFHFQQRGLLKTDREKMLRALESSLN